MGPALLRSAMYRRSGMGYGGCFHDAGLLDDDFYDCFVRPLVGSRPRMLGVTRHADIRVPVQLVRGADDPTFPVARARSMAAQFPTGRGLHEIPRARLLVHEERPAEVAAVTLPFLRG
jgi:pimeloyl-ACP methyl ester carboxylesterase